MNLAYIFHLLQYMLVKPWYHIMRRRLDLTPIVAGYISNTEATRCFLITVKSAYPLKVLNIFANCFSLKEIFFFP